MARIGLAVNRRYQRDGEWQEQTSFFYGTVWREQAESVAESLQKGARVIVSGQMEQRTWQDKDGQDRESIEIRIDEIGPSLRWATATVNKTQRQDNWSEGNKSSSSGSGSGGASAPSPRDDYGPDEAPF
jgi:single-strand DNA-binding protein